MTPHHQVDVLRRVENHAATPVTLTFQEFHGGYRFCGRKAEVMEPQAKPVILPTVGVVLD